MEEEDEIQIIEATREASADKDSKQQNASKRVNDSGETAKVVDDESPNQENQDQEQNQKSNETKGNFLAYPSVSDGYA